MLYAPIFYELYRARWVTIDYTHAYFILPVSLWLAWRKRREIKELVGESQPRKSPLSLILLLFGISMFIFGWRQEYLFISTVSLIPVLFGMTGYLYSREVPRRLLFPILYLLLLVPPPLGILDNITLPMRKAVSFLTEVIFKTFHYPITRDALLLSIGGHEIYMGSPCSGFRSLITMFSLGLAYAYIAKTSMRNKVILVASTAPFALLGNLIRVSSMCMVTYYLGDSAGHTFHDVSGFIIFIITILGLLWLENYLDKHE